MKAFKCDICGQYFDKKVSLEFNLSSVVYPVTVDLKLDTKDFDFCEKCLRASVKKDPKVKNEV